MLVKRMQDDLDTVLEGCPETDRKYYEEENNHYLHHFYKFIRTTEQPILWDHIEPYPLILNYLSLFEREKINILLKKLVVVKLNGGLGTRMNFNGPKSLLSVRDELNFLDLTMQQIAKLNFDYKVNVPLVLMNSFDTQEETNEVLSNDNDLKLRVISFEQCRFPRIKADNNYNLLCSSYNDANPAVWYSPGDGNFFESFEHLGLLDQFLSEGKEYVFISDIDNLGATVDFQILQLMGLKINGKFPEFIMEVTRKTAADVKRSTLVHYHSKPKIIKYSQLSQEHTEDFKSVDKFSTFPTNNMWVRLGEMKKKISDKSLSLQEIPNRKQIMIENESIEIIQLETDAGCAIEAFEGALAVMVPRSRFLPVKTTSDLFLIRSNVFVNINGHLVRNPDRRFKELPIINLSDEHFGDYQELNRRFETMPDCLELHRLTVSGNVHFAKDVALKDKVVIVANPGERIDVPQGSILESKVLTGSLRIEDI